MKKINYFVRTKVGIVVAVVVLLLLFFVILNALNNRESEFNSFVVEQRNVSEEVNISGTVEAATDVDLAFERSGQINTISKNVGDEVGIGSVIITLENSSQSARLAQAEADLNIEIIKLEELSGNSEFGVTTSENDLRLAQIDLDNAKENLIEKIEEVFVEASDAVENDADRLFSKSGFGTTIISGSTKYNIDTTDSVKKIKINSGRSKINRIFENWDETVLENDLYNNTRVIIDDLTFIQIFLTDLAELVNGITEPEDSTIRTAFNSLKDSVSNARITINSSLSELRSSLQTYNIEKTDFEYVSSQTSSTGEDTRLQEARVLSARAKVAAELATLNQGIIRSPVNGKVTSIKTKIGEVVSANTAVVTVVSDALYEVVVNIPEADVSKISIGNIAKITLDAYSDSDIFSAKVTSVDLSETIIDGVTTYEARLQFEEKDQRIRSGMTANVEIFGRNKENVLAVPQRALMFEDGKKKIRIVNSNGETEYVEVETGLRSTDGFIEIISGLEEGDVILTS